MGNVSWVNIMHSPFFFGPGGMGLNVVLLGVDVFFVFPISDGIGDIWAKKDVVGEEVKSGLAASTFVSVRLLSPGWKNGV